MASQAAAHVSTANKMQASLQQQRHNRQLLAEAVLPLLLKRTKDAAVSSQDCSVQESSSTRRVLLRACSACEDTYGRMGRELFIVVAAT